MGLRCLLGHNFGEPELQREREEDGSEVVTTVTEVKTCARCGETQVVSENTEVTTMEQLTDEATAASGDPTDSGADRERETPVRGADEGGADSVEAETASETMGADAAGLSDDVDGGDGDDAVIIDDDSADDDANDGPAASETVAPRGTGEAESTVETDADADGEGDGAALIDDEPSGAGPNDGRGTDPDGDALERDEGEYAAYPEAETTEAPADEERAETDDGVILDEGDETADDRERGAWPDVEESDEGAGATTPWPEHGGEDEGFSAEVGEGDTGEVEFGGGLTPEAADPPADGEDEDAEYVEAPARTPGAGDGAAETGAVDEGVGITRGESPELETSNSEVTTEYYCPECEMTRAADGNSMRAGDICPECKRGYVDERPI